MGTGFRESSCLSKLVLILVIVAFLFHNIGFYTLYWSIHEYRLYPRQLHVKEYYGLWKHCTWTKYMTLCKNFKNWGSWFEATQAFETLGFIAAIAALILIILYVFVPQTSGKKIVFILSMLACFAAAGCIILGIIIYGANIQYDLSWSFALCTIAGVIFAVAGILLVVDMLKR